MSLETNGNILVGSVETLLDKRFILGKNANSYPVILASIIIEMIEYCTDQYNAGNTSYADYIKTLNRLIQKLKYQCPDVCIYRDRIIAAKDNTPPTIDDNEIDLVISNDFQDLVYSDVVYNYQDAENDLVSQIVVTQDNTNDGLNVNGVQVVVNDIYLPVPTFSAKYSDGTNSYYFIDNQSLPCNPQIIKVDEAWWDTQSATSVLVDIYTPGLKTQFQRITDKVLDLPNDTKIFVFLDNTSMSVDDISTLSDALNLWYYAYDLANPGNTVEIFFSNAPAYSNMSTIGGIGYGLAGFPFTIEDTPRECWLSSPLQGILRYAYKNGTLNFADVNALTTYIEGTISNYIVLAFMDESIPDYHSNGTPFHFSDIGGGPAQPSQTYLLSYLDFMYTIRPAFDFFKGVLYPITRINDSDNPAFGNNYVTHNFLLHAVSAIEAEILTSGEFDALLGVDKVAEYNNYDPTYLPIFYAALASNPYTGLAGLKGAGWEGRYDKFYPAEDVFTSDEFAEELEELLEDTQQNTSTIYNTTRSSSVVSGLSTNFDLKVRDNHSYNPLFSNEATITINFNEECEDVPTCSLIESIDLEHHRETPYVFEITDFTAEVNVDKIKIISLTNPMVGTLYWHYYPVTNADCPIAMSRSDIEAGLLTYVVDYTEDLLTTVDVEYVLSYEDSTNYCDNLVSNTLSVNKEANPNLPAPAIEELHSVFSTKTVILPAGFTTNEAYIDSFSGYWGSGDVYYFWSTTTPLLGTMTVETPLERVLMFDNINMAGNIGVELTIVTEEDLFTDTMTGTIIIVEDGVNGGADAGRMDEIYVMESYTVSDAQESTPLGWVSRLWTFVSGPVVAGITGAATMTPTFTGMTDPGVYRFNFAVTELGPTTYEDQKVIIKH